MNGLLILLALILIGAGIALTVMRVRNSGTVNIKSFGPLLVFVALGLGVLFFQSALLNARDGFAYRIINPSGEKYAIMTPGWKIINPWANVQEWNKFIDIRTITEGESTDGIEGVINQAIPVRFTDQVTGSVNLAVRVQIPEDEPSFLKVAEIFRHPMNLTNNTLIPAIREQVINTTYMFTAEGYVNGEAGEYRQTIDDALKNGGFKMEKNVDYDTIYADINVNNVVDAKRVIKEIKPIYTTEKVLDSKGIPIRYEHDITKYNFIIAQAIIEGLSLEPKFQQKLEQQRDISAEKSIEADKIEKAKISQQRILAEGERDKAAERVKQEKEQITKLIAIETKVKEEESKRQLAVIALETERLTSTRRKVAADAKKYELQQADGLSEEQKYRIDKDVEAQIGVARALAGDGGLKLPSTYIGGSGQNGTSQQDIMNLLLLQMMNGKK